MHAYHVMHVCMARSFDMVVAWKKDCRYVIVRLGRLSYIVDQASSHSDSSRLSHLLRTDSSSTYTAWHRAHSRFLQTSPFSTRPDTSPTPHTSLTPHLPPSPPFTNHAPPPTYPPTDLPTTTTHLPNYPPPPPPNPSNSPLTLSSVSILLN